jgi:hypothetical protein
MNRQSKSNHNTVSQTDGFLAGAHPPPSCKRSPMELSISMKVLYSMTPLVLIYTTANS